jgi:hypothetical protein
MLFHRSDRLSCYEWKKFGFKSSLTEFYGIFIIKETRCTNFSNLFWNETLHVSDNFSVHHQEFFTIYTAMVYVLQFCRQISNRIRLELISILILPASCQQTRVTYTIAVSTVKNSWCWTEELSETCRVSFQNKFEKLVHLVGFIIRNGHNARLHELKIHGICQTSYQTSGIELQMKHGSCLPYHLRFNIMVSFQPIVEAVNRRAQICLITIL